MGWTNSHLHCFEVGDKRYIDQQFMDPAFDDASETSYAGIRVSELVAEYGSKLQLDCEYDFGDGWQHTVKLEK